MYKQLAKSMLRRLGFELRRYSVQTSETARLHRLLAHFEVDLVFDVGANCGQFASSLRANDYRGKIVSFEPLGAAHNVLQKASQSDDKWIVAPRTALGNSTGSLVINVSQNSVSSSAKAMLASHVNAAPDSRYVSTETVPLTRLDDAGKRYLSGSKSPYLKIDTQGYEFEILQGAEGMLSQIKGIQLELSLVPLYEGQVLFQDMLKIMAESGFQLYGMMPAFTDPSSGRILQMDGIFFRV